LAIEVGSKQKYKYDSTLWREEEVIFSINIIQYEKEGKRRTEEQLTPFASH
jgi:hypothetical protein